MTRLMFIFTIGAIAALGAYLGSCWSEFQWIDITTASSTGTRLGMLAAFVFGSLLAIKSSE